MKRSKKNGRRVRYEVRSYRLQVTRMLALVRVVRLEVSKRLISYNHVLTAEALRQRGLSRL